MEFVEIMSISCQVLIQSYVYGHCLVVSCLRLYSQYHNKWVHQGCVVAGSNNLKGL